MMTLEYKQSLTELNIIIHYMNVEYLNKLPQKFIDFVNRNMDANYKPNISKNIPINEQELKKDTKVLLSLLYRNYWCDSEVKKELLNEDTMNKEQYEQEIREKYNPDNIFQNNNQDIEETIEQVENVSLVEYKESFFKKLIKKIKSIFHIN